MMVMMMTVIVRHYFLKINSEKRKFKMDERLLFKFNIYKYFYKHFILFPFLGKGIKERPATVTTGVNAILKLLPK